MKRSFPNKKKEHAIIVEALITSLPSVHMRSKTSTRRIGKRTRPTIERARSTWERLTLGMNGSTSEEDEKVATIAIHKSSPTPRLFNDMFDDDYYSPHICLMAKGEKVKPKSKSPPPPPSDISSSDISDSSSDDESSDKEINMITKNLDRKIKLFITKLMEELESVQAEIESREETLIQ